MLQVGDLAGATALYLAAENGHAASARLLLEAGADAEAATEVARLGCMRYHTIRCFVANRKRDPRYMSPP